MAPHLIENGSGTWFASPSVVSSENNPELVGHTTHGDIFCQRLCRRGGYTAWQLDYSGHENHLGADNQCVCGFFTFEKDGCNSPGLNHAAFVTSGVTGA